jgi:hypothetical protein
MKGGKEKWNVYKKECTISYTRQDASIKENLSQF